MATNEVIPWYSASGMVGEGGPRWCHWSVFLAEMARRWAQLGLFSVPPRGFSSLVVSVLLEFLRGGWLPPNGVSYESQEEGISLFRT